MSLLISDIFTSAESKFHGTTLNKLTNIYGTIFEAATNVLAGMDPRETKRIQSLSGSLYDQVYSYVLPSDLKNNAIIDVRPQGDRDTGDNFSQVYGEDFDRHKKNNTLQIEDNSGVRTLRVAKALRPGVTLNEFDSTTANGTWTAAGQAGTLTADTFNKITGSASLRFNLTTGGTTSYLENSTMSAVDLTDYLDVGALFLWVYIPSTSVITGVALRWGSDTTNYYSNSVTAASDNTAFRVGWNLLRFDWSTATTTGTPTVTAIDTLRVTFTHTSSNLSAVRVDSCVARSGEIWEAVYYSKYLFQSSAGTWLEKPTATTDIINLDTDSYNVLLYEIFDLAAQEIQGEDSGFDAKYWSDKRDRAWADYRATHKSEKMKPQASYYRSGLVRRRN